MRQEQNNLRYVNQTLELKIVHKKAQDMLAFSSKTKKQECNRDQPTREKCCKETQASNQERRIRK